MGPVSWALHTTILRDRKRGILKISQEQFTSEFLTRSKFVPVKEKLRGKICPYLTQDVVDENLKKRFQSDIGAMWWLAQISRPDIFYAVHRCSKLQNNPTKRLGQKIEKIKTYLADTISTGIVFQRCPEGTPLLSGYVDASFATGEEGVSRIGYFFLFKGNLVSWCSENPKRIMTSSTEVECRGLVQISKENFWHRQFHQEVNLYQLEGPTSVYEDNSASITMSTDLGVPHKRSKHFGIEWAFFKESVEQNEIQPVYVPTENQPADMLTKNLSPTKFLNFVILSWAKKSCKTPS